MYTLNKEQIELIAAGVRKAGITIPDLAEDLIDHICCEVENCMYHGKTFDQAYQAAKERAGTRVLQEIEENTRFLIDKNYRIMKITMKITGNVSMVMLAAATLMRLFHIPGANVVLVPGFILLAVVFFPAAIWSSYRDSKTSLSGALHLSILAGGILLMAGILFKVMHWPGAGVVIGTGWLLVIFLFLPLLLYVKLKNATRIEQRLIVLSGVGGLLIFELASMFRMFHWPGVNILLATGAIILISVFLPFYSRSELRETGRITGPFIFVHLLAVYFILFGILLSVNPELF